MTQQFIDDLNKLRRTLREHAENIEGLFSDDEADFVDFICENIKSDCKKIQRYVRSVRQ